MICAIRSAASVTDPRGSSTNPDWMRTQLARYPSASVTNAAPATSRPAPAPPGVMARGRRVRARRAADRAGRCPWGQGRRRLIVPGSRPWRAGSPFPDAGAHGWAGVGVHVQRAWPQAGRCRLPWPAWYPSARVSSAAGWTGRRHRHRWVPAARDPLLFRVRHAAYPVPGRPAREVAIPDGGVRPGGGVHTGGVRAGGGVGRGTVRADERDPGRWCRPGCPRLAPRSVRVRSVTVPSSTVAVSSGPAPPEPKGYAARRRGLVEARRFLIPRHQLTLSLSAEAIRRRR